MLLWYTVCWSCKRFHPEIPFYPGPGKSIIQLQKVPPLPEIYFDSIHNILTSWYFDRSISSIFSILDICKVLLFWYSYLDIRIFWYLTDIWILEYSDISQGASCWRQCWGQPHCIPHPQDHPGDLLDFSPSRYFDFYLSFLNLKTIQVNSFIFQPQFCWIF